MRVLLIFLLACFHLAAQASVTWSVPTVTGKPHANGWYILLTDPVSGKVILYSAVAGSGSIYSTNLYLYDPTGPTMTNLGGTGDLTDVCSADKPTQPGSRHPYGQETIDTLRNRLYIFGGAAAACAAGTATVTGTAIVNAGAVQFSSTWVGESLLLGGVPCGTVASFTNGNNITLASNTCGASGTVSIQLANTANRSPRSDTYYWDLVSTGWTQLSPSHVPPTLLPGQWTYDPDDDVIFAYGLNINSGSQDQWIYCVTNADSGIRAKQVTAGCTNGDDWNEINHGVPPMAAVQQVGMVYDTIDQKMILFAGATSGGTRKNDTWIYDVPSHTWTQKCSGGCTPPPATTTSVVIPAMVYLAETNKVIFHQVVNTGSPQTWTYDLQSDTWAMITTNGGGSVPSGSTQNIALGYYPGTRTLVGWNQGSSDSLWQGQVFLTSTSSIVSGKVTLSGSCAVH